MEPNLSEALEYVAEIPPPRISGSVGRAVFFCFERFLFPTAYCFPWRYSRGKPNSFEWAKVIAEPDTEKCLVLIWLLWFCYDKWWEDTTPHLTLVELLVGWPELVSAGLSPSRMPLNSRLQKLCREVSGIRLCDHKAGLTYRLSRVCVPCASIYLAARGRIQDITKIFNCSSRCRIGASLRMFPTPFR